MLIYLLKANIALTMFFLAYRFGLRRLTFYTLNRIFLLTGIAFSSLYPFISIDTFMNKHEVIAGKVMTYVPDFTAWQAAAPAFTIRTALVYIFWAGVSVMAIRFCIQLFSLWKIHRKSQPGKLHDIAVQLLQQPVNPFSFFRHIYINPSLHQPEDLPAILHHEKVHVRQWHTADALLGEINHIFYWFNPGAWLMKTAIRENLEFITDRYLLQQGVDKTSYQYNLIKVSGIPYATAIANNFNFSHLKKRIIMMNSKRSSRYQLLRYGVLGILVGALVLSLNYTKASTALHFITVTDSVPKNAAAPTVSDVKPATPQAAPAAKTVKVAPAPQTATFSIDVKASGEPLYIVNGKVVTKAELDAIKPGDIATVNVVKDPSPEMKENMEKAYGADVSNGIVFVQLNQPSAPIGITIKGKTDGKIPNDVLVLVNGVPRPAGKGYGDIPSENINTVNVLKGEGATATYGPAAKNGVILITTKDGKQEKNTIEVRVITDSTQTK
jgi:TonB-dependent SusC/RagA subfamily outer membrane receptor